MTPASTASIAEAITVDVDCPAWAGVLPDAEAQAAQAARAALAKICPALGIPAGISLLLTDDDALQTLNRDWRGKDTPTNVLAFPTSAMEAGTLPQPEFPGVPVELGDIALAFQTCAREAEAQGKPLLHHLRHLVVHGVLHLLGYDHQDDLEAGVMEGREAEVLATLGVPDPYAAERALETADG